MTPEETVAWAREIIKPVSARNLPPFFVRTMRHWGELYSVGGHAAVPRYIYELMHTPGYDGNLWNPFDHEVGP